MGAMKCFRTGHNSLLKCSIIIFSCIAPYGPCNVQVKGTVVSTLPVTKGGINEEQLSNTSTTCTDLTTFLQVPFAVINMQLLLPV